jgi:single stranded DNA-binding protein (ssb)
MANLSTIQLIGRLGNDPELKHTPNGKLIASFSLAVNRRRGDAETTTWYRCSCFGRLAETVDQLTQKGAMTKGREVCVTGSFEPREYQANDGAMKWSFDVACDNMQLLGSRDAAEQPANSIDDVPF